MARKVQELDELPGGLVEEVVEMVRQSGAIPLSRLTRAKLTRRASGLLHEQLARRGLERTGRAVRVPVREQVLAAIAGGPLPTAAVRKRVRGLAGAGELGVAIADLVRGGRAAVIMRGGVEHIAPPSAEVLGPGELAAVVELARTLGKAAGSVRRRAGRPARSLWRADLVALIEQARAALGDRLAQIVDAVRRHASPVTGLAPVPVIARALGRDIREPLLAAAAAGLVELRPESGVDLLAPADAELCPRGPDGWPLSWARAQEPR